jgi:hypothetical protein
MRWQIPLVVALVAFVAVSCDQQPVEPQADQVAEAPAFNYVNGPSEAGLVLRYEGGVAFWLADEKTGLGAIVGVDLAAWCVGPAAFDLVDFNSVYWEELGRWVDLYQGTDMSTAVWPFTNFDCNLFTTTDPLAEGYTKLVGTDNDVIPGATESPRTNSWGVRAHGDLYDGDGGKHQFSAYEQCVWHFDTGEDAVCRYKVNLN